MKPRTRLLFIDDDRSYGEAVTQTLEQMGYDARSESDPRKVLAKFTTNSPGFDGVIVDQLMPGLSGLELARWLSYTRPHIPVILLSESPDLMYATEEEPSNVRGVLFKPLSRTKLSEALGLAFPAVGWFGGMGDKATLSPWQ